MSARARAIETLGFLLPHWASSEIAKAVDDLTAHVLAEWDRRAEERADAAIQTPGDLHVPVPILPGQSVTVTREQSEQLLRSAAPPSSEERCACGHTEDEHRPYGCGRCGCEDYQPTSALASPHPPADGRPDREALGRAVYEAWCAAKGDLALPWGWHPSTLGKTWEAWRVAGQRLYEMGSKDAAARAEAAEGHLRVHEAALNEATDVLDAVKDAVHFAESRANRVLPEIVRAVVLRRDTAEARVRSLEANLAKLIIENPCGEGGCGTVASCEILAKCGPLPLRSSQPGSGDDDGKERTT